MADRRTDGQEGRKQRTAATRELADLTDRLASCSHAHATFPERLGHGLSLSRVNAVASPRIPPSATPGESELSSRSEMENSPHGGNETLSFLSNQWIKKEIAGEMRSRRERDGSEASPESQGACGRLGT